jgi:putative NADPH-quinone reductase
MKSMGERRGHAVKVADLYAIDFDPRLKKEEIRCYFTPLPPDDERRAFVEDLKWCDALTLVYPTWWYGMPAIMKGYIDRVFLPNSVLALKEDGFGITGLLQNIKAFAVVTTHGSPWWWIKLRMRDPGRHSVMRAIPPLLNPAVKSRWLTLYNLDRTTLSARTEFGIRMERSLERLLDRAAT